jgi:hypothetical protein
VLRIGEVSLTHLCVLQTPKQGGKKGRKEGRKEGDAK